MKRLLLVDDHDLFRQVLAVVLEQHTDLEEHVQAASLDEARRVLGALNGEVDLAIVDLDLPQEEGTELIEDLHALDIPVLAFTADRSLEGRARALRVGADEVLSTATSGEKILDTAKRLIGG
jgi:DNA-binding NarL/FixJ family response regulator